MIQLRTSHFFKMNTLSPKLYLGAKRVRDAFIASFPEHTALIGKLKPGRFCFRVMFPGKNPDMISLSISCPPDAWGNQEIDDVPELAYAPVIETALFKGFNFWFDYSLGYFDVQRYGSPEEVIDHYLWLVQQVKEMKQKEIKQKKNRKAKLRKQMREESGYQPRIVLRM